MWQVGLPFAIQVLAVSKMDESHTLHFMVAPLSHPDIHIVINHYT